MSSWLELYIIFYVGLIGGEFRCMELEFVLLVWRIFSAIDYFIAVKKLLA